MLLYAGGNCNSRDTGGNITQKVAIAPGFGQAKFATGTNGGSHSGMDRCDQRHGVMQCIPRQL